MHTGRRYRLLQTLAWSRLNIALPLLWAIVACALYELLELRWLALPWLPMSAVGVAVAFYLGFKNNASYGRLWEARMIWGAIVNASRAWAFSARDLVTDLHASQPVDADAMQRSRESLVQRHVAWLDALRHQLRQLRTWEHQGPAYQRAREASNVPEYKEDLRHVLAQSIDADEVDEVLAQINPAARLLANQSRELSKLRAAGLLDGYAHMQLQSLLQALVGEQGKAERIKNFPFPRQYATINTFFAWLFALLVPFGMIEEFSGMGDGLAWLVVPFSTLVSWVFLTTDQIGEWSENPFEGLANDVPISTMARGIERDMLQMIDRAELPPAREPYGMLQF
jgi:putative membrane protein